MIIVILTVVIAVVAMWSVFKTMALDDYVPMPVAGTFVALLAGGLICLLGYGASATVTYSSNDYRTVSSTTYDLRALDTGSESQGSMFLGSGYFESGPAYTYLSERGDGGFEMASIETNNAIVYQTDERSPSLVTSMVAPSSKMWSIVAVSGKHKFYVPEGSVQGPEYRVSVER